MVNTLSAPKVRIRCRQIADADLGALADLFGRGFPERSRDYWLRGFAHQAARPQIEDFPRHGYLLEADGRPVGAILLLFSLIGGAAARCNVSSWYVEPDFRGHASLLVAVALKHKAVTYVNISPARHTWPTIEAQGFSCYCRGQVIGVPLLRLPRSGMRVAQVMPGSPDALGLGAEHELLAEHAGYGCISLVCATPQGPQPFVFLRSRVRKGRLLLPAARLLYCRDIAEFVRCASAIAWALLRRGLPLVLVDANGPVAGLPGAYRDSRERRYVRGPDTPRLGDLAYTELALFGDEVTRLTERSAAH